MRDLCVQSRIEDRITARAYWGNGGDLKRERRRYCHILVAEATRPSDDTSFPFAYFKLTMAPGRMCYDLLVHRALGECIPCAISHLQFSRVYPRQAHHAEGKFTSRNISAGSSSGILRVVIGEGRVMGSYSSLDMVWRVDSKSIPFQGCPAIECPHLLLVLAPSVQITRHVAKRCTAFVCLTPAEPIKDPKKT